MLNVKYLNSSTFRTFAEFLEEFLEEFPTSRRYRYFRYKCENIAEALDSGNTERAQRELDRASNGFNECFENFMDSRE